MAIVPISPNYLNSFLDNNPLLKTDLSETLSHHRWQKWQNEILSKISLAAFIALTIFVIHWLVFADPTLAAPLLLSMTVPFIEILKGFRDVIYDPFIDATNKHWELYVREQRIEKLMKTPLDEATFRDAIGALPLTNTEPAKALSKGKTFTQAYARYQVIDLELYGGVDPNDPETKVFGTAEKIDSLLRTYRSYLESSRDPTQSAQETQRINSQELPPLLAKIYKLENKLLEYRIEQALLIYAVSHPLRKGPYGDVGATSKNAELAADALNKRFGNESPFYVFHPNTHRIDRDDDLLNPHKELSEKLARHLLNPDSNLSPHLQTLKETLIALQETPYFERTELYLKKEFASHINRIINRHFINIFVEHDSFSIRADLKDKLYLASSLFACFLLPENYPKELQEKANALFQSVSAEVKENLSETLATLIAGDPSFDLYNLHANAKFLPHIQSAFDNLDQLSITEKIEQPILDENSSLEQLIIARHLMQLGVDTTPAIKQHLAKAKMLITPPPPPDKTQEIVEAKLSELLA